VPKQEKTLNAVVGDVIRGEFTKYGLTLEMLAERTNIPYGTLRKKIVGTSPIFVTELISITKAIDPHITEQQIIDEAQGIWQRMSAARATNDLQTKRTQKEAEARTMTPDQLEEVTRRAATRDPELEQDEPPTP